MVAGAAAAGCLPGALAALRGGAGGAGGAGVVQLGGGQGAQVGRAPVGDAPRAAADVAPAPALEPAGGAGGLGAPALPAKASTWDGGPFADSRYWGRQEGQEGFCDPVETTGGRPLLWVAPPGGEWPRPDLCAGPRLKPLCNVVSKMADDRRAVMATVANAAVTAQVRVLHESLVKSGVDNFLVIALDEGMVKFCQDSGIPFYHSPNDARGNHAVSAMKFGIIKDFVEVGCSVLLTDTDVVYMQNPFPRLYYDSDLEGMSDGWDNVTTYGYMEAYQDIRLDSGAMTKHSVRTAALNSGLWFVAATKPSLRFLQQLETLVSTETIWDQTAYNLKVQRPSYGPKTHPGVTFRALNPLCFCNSKVVTRYIMPSPHLGPSHVPVAVHVNYHPDKERKVEQLNKLYLKGETALATTTLNAGGLLDPKPLEPVEVVDNLRKASQMFSGPSAVDLLAELSEVTKCKPLPNKLLARELRLLPNAAPRAQSGGREHTAVKGEWPSKEDCPADRRLARVLVDEEQRNLLCGALADSAYLGDVLAVFVDGDHAAGLLAPFLQSPGLKNLGNVLVVSLTTELTGSSTEGIAKSLGWLAGTLPAPAGPQGWSYARSVGAKARLGFLSAPGASRFEVGEALVGLGAGVLLADPATVFLQDPFKHLYRDHDLEALSDGHRVEGMVMGDDSVVDDVYMGWSRFGHGFRLSTMDPGLFFAVPTEEAVRFLGNVGRRMRDGEGGGRGDWGRPQGERLAFNMELFRLTHDGYMHSGAQIRAMQISCWLSAHAVFKEIPEDKLNLLPKRAVAVRISSTTPADVAGKMGAVAGAFGDKGLIRSKWQDWKTEALDDSICAAQINVPSASAAEGAAAAVKILSNPDRQSWLWGGTPGFKFLAGGELQTPWGEGKWGTVEGGPEASVEAEFVGARHHLTFMEYYGEPFSVFRSVRCGDGDVVTGTREK